MDSEKAFAQLKGEVDAWVASIKWDEYPKLPMPKPDETKVIREAVTGYQILWPHEYMVLDSPLLQRLRYIHQTALAYLVYPTANHTRFDHSLGCAKTAQQIGEKVIGSGEKTRIAELRLAALLHDVGHTFFSHLSETIMQSRFRNLYIAVKGASQFKGHDMGLAEMSSYLIVKSEQFHAFLDKVVHYYRDFSMVDLDNVANLIIRAPVDGLAFMGDIISGPFDADKLDYLVRDCHFCGIRADVDVERVLVSAALLDRKRFPSSAPEWSKYYLVMLSAGESILEQITFNRMLLYPAIYHHHKVRAIECMIRAIFETIWEDPDNIRNEHLKFENIHDFYRLTDFQFLAAVEAEPQLRPIIERLMKRDLFKRCLVMSLPYLEKTGKFIDLYKKSSEDYPEKLYRLRDIIWEELPKDKRGSIHDLWVDIPKPPTSIAKDPDSAWIDIGTRKMLRLRDFFPYPGWVTSYEINKWKGHVFSISDPSTRCAVNEAAKRVFKDKPYYLEFGERATEECKIPRG
ncbi:MAG: HD domain-containing protein [Chloroflexota bacterium]